MAPLLCCQNRDESMGIVHPILRATMAILNGKEWYPRFANYTKSVFQIVMDRFHMVGKLRVPLLCGQNREERHGDVCRTNSVQREYERAK